MSTDIVDYRLEKLERAVLCGSVDRIVYIPEIAAALGKAPETVRGWLKSGRDRQRNGCDQFLRRDPTGRWCTTANELEKWKWWRIGGGR